MKGSITLTPSLRRRWMMGGQFKAKEGFWETVLPVRIEEGEAKAFVRFMTESLGR